MGGDDLVFGIRLPGSNCMMGNSWDDGYSLDSVSVGGLLGDVMTLCRQFLIFWIDGVELMQ